MDETIKIKVLNEDRDDGGNVIETNEGGSDLIKELKISLTNLKSNFMDEETGKVNYLKMLKSEDFASYRK